MLASPRFHLDPLSHGKWQRERSNKDVRLKGKLLLPSLWLRSPRWVMLLAGSVDEQLGERLAINNLFELDEQQQKKSVPSGLAINVLQLNEQPLKKAASKGHARKRVSVKDVHTSARQKEKADRLKDAVNRLDERGTQASFQTYASLLRQCADAKVLLEGKRLHAHILRSGYGGNRVLANLLIHMYGSCGNLDNARAVFDRIRQPNVFTGSMMISAFLCNGLLDDARNVFDEMPQRDVVAWTVMIAGYAQNGRGKEALELFQRMAPEGTKPNKVTFISALDACASLAEMDADAALTQGYKIHANIIDSGFEMDVVVATTLVNMYGKCGSPDDARSTFDKMHQRNVVSWNAMIAAYAQNGRGKESLELFQRMDLEGVKPDKITFVSVLDACASPAALVQGQGIHASAVFRGFETDKVVGTALINMYGKCGSPDDAANVFDKMRLRDVVSWTAIIAAHAQNGRGKEALELFHQMDLEGVKPDKITCICALDACASLAALAQGQGIHAFIVDCRFETDVVVGTALVNMYGKCGSPDDARRVFDKMPQRNVVSWTAMIAAYANNGYSKRALEVFRWMELEGVKPNKISFTNILFACSHAGLLGDGWRYLVSMSRDLGITPTTEQYGCMIDLIGRAGQLNEAEDLINAMPSQPDVVAWEAFLGACRIHGDMERGAFAAKQVLKLDSKNTAPYVLLSNIYAAAGRWGDVAQVRHAMYDAGVKKHPGLSFIEVKKRVYQFTEGDMIHAQKNEIYAELQRLGSQLKDVGYIPGKKVVLHDVEDEEKEHLLCYHSEKLAIAFGLISTPAGEPLCIIKNLRVCSNCHAATKFISKIVGRKIIVRAGNRFHHFENGVCLCGDYW